MTDAITYVSPGAELDPDAIRPEAPGVSKQLDAIRSAAPGVEVALDAIKPHAPGVLASLDATMRATPGVLSAMGRQPKTLFFFNHFETEAAAAAGSWRTAVTGGAAVFALSSLAGAVAWRAFLVSRFFLAQRARRRRW